MAAPTSLAALDVAGVYINLDRSSERRAGIEAELARVGIAADYARFSAVDGETVDPRGSRLRPGEIGCFRSHLGALRAFESGNRHVHVVEDDVVFSTRLAPTIGALASSGILDRYDLIFFDTVVAVGAPLVRHYRSLEMRQAASRPFAVLDFKNHDFASTSSYLVNRRSIAKVTALLERELAAGPNVPLDLCYCNLMRSDDLRIGCVFPFVTTVRLNSTLRTTIDGRDGGSTVRFACDLLRYSFFVERDWATARRAIDEFDPKLRSDPRDEIIGAAFAIATDPNSG